MPVINRHGHIAGQQITKRLDVLGNLQSGCLGVSWWFVRVLCATGGAWAMAAVHMTSFAYLGRLVDSDFKMQPSKRALVGGITMPGAILGAFFFGNLADTRGRKFALLVAFTLAHLASACSAVSPDVHVLTALRFVVGIGLGGEQPIICALIMELAPGNIRGRALVYLSGFSVVGALVMTLLCRELAPAIGWRAMTACNFAALLYIPVIYYFVPESPKWLATTGFYKEAVAVLRDIEQASSVFQGEGADEMILSIHEEDTTRGRDHTLYAIQDQSVPTLKAVVDRARVLLQYPYLARTVMLWVTWTGMATSEFATFVSFGEDFLHGTMNGGAEDLVTYGSLVAQMLGNLAAAELVDRIGRRYTLIGFLVVASGGSLLEVYVGKEAVPILLASCCRNFGLLGAWSCLYTYTPELYPISVRVVGISYAWGISRLGAFAGPFAVVLIAENSQLGTPVVMWVVAAISLFVAVVVALFGIETSLQCTAEENKDSLVTTTDRPTEIAGHLVMYTKHEDEKPGFV
ncbi:Metal ion transporter [Globisporangium polare]